MIHIQHELCKAFNSDSFSSLVGNQVNYSSDIWNVHLWHLSSIGAFLSLVYKVLAIWFSLTCCVSRFAFSVWWFKFSYMGVSTAKAETQKNLLTLLQRWVLVLVIHRSSVWICGDHGLSQIHLVKGDFFVILDSKAKCQPVLWIWAKSCTGGDLSISSNFLEPNVIGVCCNNI